MPGISLCRTIASRSPTTTRNVASIDVFTHFEAQIGHDLPELLVLELLQPSHLGRQQAIIFALPVKIRGLADRRLAAEFF